MQWAVVVFIIVVAVVSAIAQTVKNQQDKEPPRRRPNRAGGDGVKTGSSDMDRFLQEIEKLRKRTADGGDEPKKSNRNNRGAKAVPMVAPVKRPKRSDMPTIAPTPRVDRLPPATVLLPPPLPTMDSSPITDSAPQPSDAPAVTRKSRPVGTSPFGKSLLAMLGDKQTLPVVFVLQEIFGPPKCKQNKGFVPPPPGPCPESPTSAT